MSQAGKKIDRLQCKFPKLWQIKLELQNSTQIIVNDYYKELWLCDFSQTVQYLDVFYTLKGLCIRAQSAIIWSYVNTEAKFNMLSVVQDVQILAYTKPQYNVQQIHWLTAVKHSRMWLAINATTKRKNPINIEVYLESE